MIAHRRQQPSSHRQSSPDRHQQHLPLQSARRSRSQGRSLQQRQPTRRRTVPATTASTSYPIHEKYDLQEVYNVRMMNSDTVVVKAQRLQRPDETINIDLPAFFMYKLNASDKKWVMVKGPTSKF